MSTSSGTYARLRQAIDAFPVIDCHEHTVGPRGAPENREPIACLMAGYVLSDLLSVALPGTPGARPDLEAYLLDQSVPTEEKWPLLERLWRQTEHTAYARVTRRILKEVYGEQELTLGALQRIRERLLNLRDPAIYRSVLDRAGIRCRLVDIWPDMKAFIAGKLEIYERDRLLISLPAFHGLRSWQNVWDLTQVIGASVTNLDQYLEACHQIFRRMKERGAIGLKDQSAYNRTLAYENPPRSDAERLFNTMMADPRTTIGWPEARSLDDWLFHRFMEMARDLDLPVQLHTGHMAGIRNDIAKTNAVLLTPVLELHRDVRFDLFHGNWPYLGEYLYLGKNYPNVRLDLCWLHIIDPVYARNLLSEGLGAVPHAKFHAFGGDYGDDILHAAAHLSIARDVVAAALADQVDAGWIDDAEALRIAADWLHNNPNEFFNLGFERFEP
ncbi:MAG: amidohydrolase family protein [Anaerolineae bacterium]|nr:amidohydrolase family protein [Anaerolineae bacterium]